MAWQKVNVALLAQLVTALGQQSDVVGAVRRMAGHAVLLDGSVLPQKWPAFLRMTLITGLIGCGGHEHFATFSSVRVMTGDATHFHRMILGAEQMSRALVLSLADIAVAAETGLLDGEARQHIVGRLGVYQSRRLIFKRTRAAGRDRLRELGVMDAVARHATHIVSVMLSALPVIKVAVARVALETRFVCQR